MGVDTDAIADADNCGRGFDAGPELPTDQAEAVGKEWAAAGLHLRARGFAVPSSEDAADRDRVEPEEVFAEDGAQQRLESAEAAAAATKAAALRAAVIDALTKRLWEVWPIRNPIPPAAATAASRLMHSTSHMQRHCCILK